MTDGYPPTLLQNRDFMSTIIDTLNRMYPLDNALFHWDQFV
jgi:hypothetical protein